MKNPSRVYPDGYKMKKILGKEYVHGCHIANTILGAGTRIQDDNRKMMAVQKIRYPINITLTDDRQIAVFLITSHQTRYRPTLWITDAPGDLFLICPDAVKRLGEMIEVEGLEGEPLGCGSYERWAKRDAVAGQFMTALLLNK